MDCKNYSHIRVSILQRTPDPGKLVLNAARLSMSTRAEIDQEDELSDRLLKFIITAGHHSLLEHVVFTFYIENVSRALLAQVTRHRMASFTSASQHYSDYRHMPMVVAVHSTERLYTSLENSLKAYEELIEIDGMAKEEARMVLPNASAVNLIMTINASSILNMMKQRLCFRNVAEMQYFAGSIRYAIGKVWPEFARCLGPYCFYDRRRECNQGKMSCGIPHPESIYD